MNVAEKTTHTSTILFRRERASSVAPSTATTGSTRYSHSDGLDSGVPGSVDAFDRDRINPSRALVVAFGAQGHSQIPGDRPVAVGGRLVAGDGHNPAVDRATAAVCGGHADGHLHELLVGR